MRGKKVLYIFIYFIISTKANGYIGEAFCGTGASKDEKFYSTKSTPKSSIPCVNIKSQILKGSGYVVFDFSNYS